MADIVLSVASKITEYLVAPSIRHLGYVFRFARNVEDLRKEAQKLSVAQARLQNDVNEAIRQTEEIERDVEDWLTDTNKVLEEVRILDSEIEENRRCFNWCPSWHWRYRLGKKVAKKKLSVVELQETCNFRRVGHLATLPILELLKSKDFMPSKSSEKASNQIIEALKDDEVSMIGLYGMAGVGKTTLAKQVVDKARELRLFDSILFAVVSQTPDIKAIQGTIGDILDLRFQKETEEGRAAQIWHRLQERKKVFVVLDDVWKELNLAAIGIPFGDDHKGCKVLLTTRLQQVCTRMRSQMKIQLDVLSEGEAWTLFKHNAGLQEVSGYGELDDVAQQVARECRGLPLAIVTIARALREKTEDEWILANQQLKRSQLVENQDYCDDIYRCLKLSYDYLKGRKTKSCFLLCSHYPEDYEISIETLTRYAVGQGLFQDIDFIEDARRETRVILSNLQYSGLLLDTGNAETVKMHDVVRDFAHWIASGENLLMIKAGLGLKEWPPSQSLLSCTTISLMNNNIGCIPEGLACPKLQTLLLSGNPLGKLPHASFKGMKILKVLTLSDGIMSSLEGLEHLENLKSLCLVGSKLGDISSLGKLKKLEILDLRGCYLDNIPYNLGELNSLRLLDLSYVRGNYKIPPNLIRRLSKLEELYIGDCSFSQWAIGGAGVMATTASLSELKSLRRLTVLTMKANSTCFPEDFVFPKLHRYQIAINQWFDYGYIRSRSLKIAGLPLRAFKELIPDAEYLDLDSIMGAPQRFIRGLGQGGLNKLTFLRLRRCRDIQCLIDTAKQQVPAISLSNLVILLMEDMICLKELCNGLHPTGFLHKLEKFTAKNCPDMISTVPVVEGLREAIVINCPKLVVVFQLDNLLYIKEEKLLSHLTHLELELLPNLRCIWEGPIHRVILQSLRTLKVQSCGKLTSIFSLALAQGLSQLETLEVHDCSAMKHVMIDTISSDSSPLCLPKLTTLKISSCDILEYVFPISMAPDFPELKDISITNCAQLKRVFGLGQGMDGKDIVLPQLQSIVLKNLKSLSSFITENCVLVQPSLEVLEVEECPLLAPFVFEDMMRAHIKKLWFSKVGNNCQQCNRASLQGRQSSAKMEYLTVGNCEEIFRLEGAIFLSSLQNLRLKELQELQVIWKGPAQIATLENLTHLEIIECKRLKHVFSPMFATNFWQLRDLHLQGCDELEQIIAVDQTSLPSSKTHLRPIKFPKLTKILIKDCNKLKCVFPISAACGLPELEEFKVEGAAELEHVFGHEDEANIIHGEDMVLYKLKRLELLQLQSLVRLCPSDYLLMFPTWFTVIVEDCPKMITCFAVDRNNLVNGRRQKL